MTRVLDNSQDGFVGWFCPGCKRRHYVPVGPKHQNSWGWNKDLVEPTLTPSVLGDWHEWDDATQASTRHVCHAFITNGKIQFLADCTHEHAGKTVPMVKLE